MSRIMIDSSGNEMKVIEHVILRNFWEYYVIERKTNTDDVKFCYVMGAENEYGDVYMPEIMPYAISKTRKLHEVMPPPNFRWKE